MQTKIMIMNSILLFIFSFSILCAQTQEDYLEYFPMHLGDIWTYQIIEYDYFNDDTLGISYRTFEITGDTVLLDGLNYYIFSYENNYGHNAYYRIDTANLTVYDNWACEYKLDVTPDSIWTDCYGMENFISTDTSYLHDLGVEKPQLIYMQGYGIFNRTLSKGLGLTYREEGDLGFETRRYLKYAKIDGVEYGDPVSIDRDYNDIPKSLLLYQNYPNPFNPSTTIEYAVNESSIINLSIYDILGNRIKTLVNQFHNSGTYVIKFDNDNLSSGLYLYKLSNGKNHFTKKMLILK